MSFVQKRNALISALHKVVGVPVLLASQVQPEVDPPFIIYSVTADYIPDGSLGHYSLEEGATPDDLVSARVEQPTATLSFTACSINRCYDDNGVQVEVLGADEALELATLAQGFFLHTGRDAISDAGFVVVDISNATSRDALELDEMGRRFGFDVRLRYTRSDHAAVSEVEQPNIIGTVKE